MEGYCEKALEHLHLASKRRKSPGHTDREGTVKPSPSGSLPSGLEMPAHPNV